MTWWLWVILGAILVVLILFVWAICVAAGREDERRGYK